MGITRKILDWTDKKYDYIINNIDEVKHPYAKSFGLGAIEGFIDSAVIWMPILLVACVAKNKQIEELKK